MLERATQEGLTEWLHAARPKGHAAQEHRAVVAEESIVLWLVRKHCGVASFELELDEWRKERRDLGHDASFVRLAPCGGHGEVDPVRVRFE